MTRSVLFAVFGICCLFVVLTGWGPSGDASLAVAPGACVAGCENSGGNEWG